MAVEAPPRPDDAVQPEDPPEQTGELVIDAGGQLTLNVGGGKQPTTSTLRLVGGKIEVDGQLAKGEAIVLRVEAVVNEVSFRDQVDSKTDQIVGCARNHRARITGIAVV